MCLSVCSSVCPSFISHPAIHPFICSSIRLSTRLYVTHPFLTSCMCLHLCLSIQPSFIHSPSIHPSMSLSFCPSTRSASHTSTQPGSQPSARYLLSADAAPGPSGRNLPWGGTGMSRRGLSFALLHWGPAQDGHRLAAGVPPSPGCPILLAGRRPLPLRLGNQP